MSREHKEKMNTSLPTKNGLYVTQVLHHDHYYISRYVLGVGWYEGFGGFETVAEARENLASIKRAADTPDTSAFNKVWLPLSEEPALLDE